MSDDVRRLLEKLLDGDLLEEDPQRAEEILEEALAEVEERAEEDELDPQAELVGLQLEADTCPKKALQQIKTRVKPLEAVSPCFGSQAQAMVAQAYRALGDSGAARAALDEARRIAGDCDLCELDLDRREVMILRIELRPAEALALAESVLARYQALGHAGHDIHENGVANSLSVLGMVLFDLDEYARAAECFRRVLADITTAKVFLYASTMSNLGWCLYGLDMDSEESREVMGKLFGHRRRHRKVFNRSPVCATALWMEAAIHLRRGCHPPKRYRKWMLDALDIFIELGQAAEAQALAADVARTFRGDHRYQDLGREFLKSVVSQLPALAKAFRPALLVFERARSDDRDRLDLALLKLRTAAGDVSVPPLLLA